MEGANQAKVKRSAKEKVVSGLVLVCVLLAIIVCFRQIFLAVTLPSWALEAYKKDPADQNAGLKTKIASLFDLKKADTDADGLSDYDELVVYETSPYLEDSDSDGYPDKQEVDGGYDPNCPGKNNCFREDGGLSAGEADSAAADGATAADGSATVTADTTKFDAKALRNALTKTGIAEDEIGDLTDEELMALYAQIAIESGDLSALTEMDMSVTGLSGLDLSGLTNSAASVAEDNSANVNGSVADSTAAGSLENLAALTGAQIRELLLQEGMTEEILNQVSDEDLKAMFLEKLAEKVKADAAGD